MLVKECRFGFERYESNCYFFSQKQKSWQDAYYDCLSMHADLVIINNQFEYDFLKKLGKRKNFWIGATGNGENEWEWNDERPLTTSNKWYLISYSFENV